ncbi:hypothetical protein L917_21691 [Phytophthora nicotianae]|uniref:Uncharacterized protein n=1 Tax=Phytophthora nicotianae TaxID=4792 RepID=W2M2T7_PHYNI|nr:hypothetical protein L917_21691 [Phytophthora nicotianae]ETM30635.1 hypothetical protein L914_21688 [Phytophthora nicotianae]
MAAPTVVCTEGGPALQRLCVDLSFWLEVHGQ